MVTMGGDSWPPRTEYGDKWPAALQPYHEAYEAVCSTLAMSEEDISFEDDENLSRAKDFRARFRKELARVDESAVRRILEDPTSMSIPEWNGFFACVAISRHAFRWGIIPVVKIIQEQLVVDFPPSLDLAWGFLRERYGIDTFGGCVTSNYLCNFRDAPGSPLAYQINKNLPEIYRMTEYNFAHVFYAIEKLAHPMYTSMSHAVSCWKARDMSGCLEEVVKANDSLTQILACYYEIMNDSQIPRTYWMRYAQGFQAWGCTHVVNGASVSYDGLSGNQLLAFQAVDAFLGMEPYLSLQDLERYIPLDQRQFLVSLKENGFFEDSHRNGSDAALIAGQLKQMAQSNKKFREAHRARVRPYISQPAPERKMMTAGKGVLEREDRPTLKAVLTFLDGFLVRRLKVNSDILIGK
ncbi:hypothetical protein DL96DRAFT_1816761 [Flagelloscypha sp. PMI_526]|nr:hypothetical protein DL96DRAFT_1816761 [Flagelloscypha sp. PMI_526]